MKIAYCTCVFPFDEIPIACRKLKELGYDGVELWDQYLSVTTVENVRKDICSLGLEIAQLCPYFDVTGTKETLEQTYRIAEKYINMAHQLNCRHIRVFTGSVSASQATEAQFEQAAVALQTICDMAPDLLFVMELHDGSMVETADATEKMLNAVNRENLRVNLQVPLADGEDPFTSAERLGEKTVHLHAHNWNGVFENLTYLSDGDYDFKKFISILRSKGFDGYVSIEHGDHYGRHDPFEVAEHEAVYLKKLISELNSQ